MVFFKLGPDIIIESWDELLIVPEIWIDESLPHEKIVKIKIIRIDVRNL